MKLRTRKQLVNAATVSCLLAASGIVLWALTADPPSLETEATRIASAQEESNYAEGTSTVVDSKQPYWMRQLRRPLYDPPPPPQVVVKKKVRPVTVKLTGTVLEPENSQAFLKLANGSVALKRLGEQVTDDPRDGRITKITASAIVIQREDDEIQLKVDSQN